eukprot:TRINITY_DN42289_c0_g1_i1.p1 TRINITY_DN42289_c0_g1~~TRINITY_DN42289_c0_g1_i1.p1  ORF type:complete len:781 (-),score=189.66 TRINITY_DN42289_c0_g1_i1:1-2343(-)
MVSEPLPLPKGQPGLLSGPAKHDEPAGASPAASTEDLRRIALQESTPTLTRELEMMLPPGNRPMLAEMCDLGSDAQPLALAEAFAERLIDLLWAPLGGCKSKLCGLSEDELRIKVQLFWRCAVALCAMPLSHLEALSQRKLKYFRAAEHEELLPTEGASEAVARLAHIRLNLPVFSMVAGLPSEEERDQAKPNVHPSHKQNTSLCERDSDVKQEPTTDAVHDTEGDGTSLTAQSVPSAAHVDSKQGDSSASVPEGKHRSAAKHTYDVGYSKWNNFDVDAALEELDDKPKRNTSTVTIPHPEKQKIDRSAEPKELLDSAIAALQRTDNEDQTSNSHCPQRSHGSSAQTAQDECPPKEPPRDQAGKPLDLSYSKWDKFDADAALEEVDTSEETSPREKTSGKQCDQAVDASEQTVQTKSESTTTGGDDLARRLESSEPQDAPQILSSDGTSTAQSLSAEYKKWEAFDEEDLDELDDDMEDVGSIEGIALDALTGPAEEVANIKKHWRRETRQRAKELQQNESIKSPARPARPAVPSLPTGPLVERPCMYTPPEDPKAVAAKAIERDYGKWKNFDADGALLELDNEGTTEEGSAMRMTASKGSAMINCEGYTKNREEYDLDTEIEQHMGGLKKIMAQNFRDASTLKAEGNDLLRKGKAEAAAETYKKGLQTMQLAQSASVIMADSLADKQSRLIADLHRNLAAAQLALSDFEAVLKSCDEALKVGGGQDEKARYRKAVALLRLGRRADAAKETEALAALGPEHDAAVKKLRIEMAASGAETVA